MPRRHFLSAFCVALALWGGAVDACAGIADAPIHRLTWQSWSQNEGLPQISVTDVVRGPDGYLWAGTENGLARFDGSRFQTYNSITTPALQSNWVSRLLRDSKDRLWIGTTKNLVLRRNGRFEAVAMPEAGKINGLAEDGTGRIWIAADGLFTYKGASATRFPGWQGGASALLAQGDDIWAAGAGAISRIRNDTIWRLPLPAGYEDAIVSRLAWSNGKLWAATSKGLLKLEGGGFLPVPLEPQGRWPNLQSLAPDGAGGLYAGSDKALYHLVGDQVRERLGTGDRGAFAWPISILVEKEGLWLGSQTEGLRHYWKAPAEQLGQAEGLDDLNVWSYAADGKRILVGTNSGVSALEDGRFTPYLPAAALPNPVAYSLLRDRAGRLWVGTRGGLARFDPVGMRDALIRELAGTQVNGLYEDRAGKVWVASMAGLFQIHNDKVERVGEAEGLPEQRIRFVTENFRGQIWVGTENGLFHQRNDKFERIVAHGLDKLMVTSILNLADGRIVVGTYDHGLYIRDRGRWWGYSTAHGLPGLGIYFLGAKDDHLIVGGPDGIYRVPVAALGHPPAPDEALPIDMILDDSQRRLGRSTMRCRNGAGNGKGLIAGQHAYLASLAGVVRADLDAAPLAAPRAAIIGVEHDGVAMPDAHTVELPANDRDISLHFGAVDFRDGPLLQFRYRLVGLDSSWNEVQETRSAVFGNLPPGTYTFEVQARRPLESWGPTAALDVVAPPRFHETWLFRGLMLLIAGAAVYGLMRWRLHLLRRQKVALERLVLERTRALAETNLRLEEVNEALKLASYTDPLTGLHNRRFMDAQIGPATAQLMRLREKSDEDLVLGLMIVDIDHFKQMNDRFGHLAGDGVLRSVAAALAGTVREGEFALRWGGEEFLIILGATPRANLPRVAERLRHAVATASASHEITASIGFSAWPAAGAPAGHAWNTSLELADHALYAAKAGGRNCCATIALTPIPVEHWPAHVGARDIARWQATGMARITIIEPDPAVWSPVPQD